MPKKPTDYSRTIIYKLVCKDLLVTYVYVGHTTDFTKRKCQHKCACNNENDNKYQLKVYKIIRDNGNWDNWDMIEIEKYPCNDANEARARERYWYETLNATMNICVPNRTHKEYKQTEKYKEYNKQYIKVYYEINKEKLNKRKKEKFTCECGSIISYDSKITHLKSPKHINLLKEKIEI